MTYTLTLESHQLPPGAQGRRHTMAPDCWCKPTVTVVHHRADPKPWAHDGPQLLDNDTLVAMADQAQVSEAPLQDQVMQLLDGALGAAMTRQLEDAART